MTETKEAGRRHNLSSTCNEEQFAVVRVLGCPSAGIQVGDGIMFWPESNLCCILLCGIMLDQDAVLPRGDDCLRTVGQFIEYA